MKTTTLAKGYLSLFVCLTAGALSAQVGQENEGLKKEVEVVKPYKPVIPDAFKINDLPQIREQKGTTPSFDYYIKPQPVFTTSDLAKVEAANINHRQGAVLEKGLLKVGFGNYVTPYGELFFNFTGGEKNAFGLHLRHLSSHGNIKLTNGDKVKAPSANNLAELYTNHFLNEITVETRLFIDRQGFRYYGYAGEELSLEEKEVQVPFWNEKQAFTRGGINLFLQGNNTDGRALEYSGGLLVQLLGSKTGQNENLINLKWHLENEYDFCRGLLDVESLFAGVDSVFREKDGAFGKSRRTMLNARIAALFEQETTTFKVGINSYNDFTQGDYIFTPAISGSWTPAPGKVTMYGGFDSYLKNNGYSDIIGENPFVNPFSDLRNSRSRYILTAGLRGNVAQRWGYLFQADYSNIRNDHFFILTNTETAGITIRSNTFDVVYDNTKRLSLTGEVSYVHSDMTSFLLKVSHNSYDLETQASPWHRPEFETYVSFYFTPFEAIKCSADIHYSGERKALVITQFPETAEPQTETVHNLKAFTDINVAIDYQYSPKLAFWGRINNLASQKYDTWLGYTNKRLQLMAGLSYSF